MIAIVNFRERHEKLRQIFGRSAVFSDEIDAAVRGIIDEVRSGGDEAVLDLTRRFDGVRPNSLRVDPAVLHAAHEGLQPDLMSILVEAAENIRRFHEKQVRRSWFVEDGDGVVLGQRFVPLERAGIYVPGGTAAYPSSVLMCVIPAQVAGVETIHLVSPPGPDGLPHPFVCAAAALLDVDHVYAVGGAQAIAAMAFGTQSIPRVDKIVGPGNAYVAAAKRLVYGQVDIDSVAGPSEIAILADHFADPEFIAADLLSQAEHDTRASAVLVTTDEKIAAAVRDRLEQMVTTLPRREIAEKSLRDYGACVLTQTLQEAVQVINELAPEHLELLVEDPWRVMTDIRHAGAIFLGPHSPEPVGDYFAGPNHVLPTGGTARFSSALGVDDFIRHQSVIAYTAERLARTAPRIATFARAEELEGHARSVE
ncbi:MAG: histidinol dehydrogenase, partial [Rhodothermales bacterium]